MKTKKKVGWLRREDDGKLFKFWRFTGIEFDANRSDGPRTVETDLGQLECVDGRRIYTEDWEAFFFEGEPNRPLRIDHTHGG